MNFAQSKPASVRAGRVVFDANCVVCHGANGQGDGPASASLSPKPRRFVDPAWQKEVTDEDLIHVAQTGRRAADGVMDALGHVYR